MITEKPEIGTIVQDGTGKKYKVVGLGLKMAVLEEEPPIFPNTERICMSYRDFFPVEEQVHNEEEHVMAEFKKQLELYN